MTTLVTGAAGFIGFHVSKCLLENGEHVVGVDNLNDYYDVSLKQSRLALLEAFDNFDFERMDISDRDSVFRITDLYPDICQVVHLAAQAGVRHSLIDPYSYISTNVVGYINLLEAFKNSQNLMHFVYASSSSVYGANTKLPFSIEDRVDTPLSLYAATKKSMEMMSHSYSHLFGMPLTGLRFFTVYGPWGRPDMAMYIFTEKILAGEPIQLFNRGDMRRDFTYIDDIVDGIVRCLDTPPLSDDQPPCRIYNIGNHKSESLLDMISLLEKALGKEAKTELVPMQAGDFKESLADIHGSKHDFGYEPKTSLEVGIPQFVKWFNEHQMG